MLAIPTIELRDVHAVGRGGSARRREVVPAADPVDQALQWAAAGFARLQVMDLDAAGGQGDNRDAIRGVLAATHVAVQVGGGMREHEEIRSWLDEGAEWIVVGARGVEDPSWLAEQAARAPARLIVEIEVRGRQVVTRGWAASTTRSLHDLVGDLEGIPLAGLLVTTERTTGGEQGARLSLYDEACAIAPWPVIAVGGETMLDLRRLEDRGVAAVVLGGALLSGALDPRVVAEEFAS
ncbi:MAG: HisA/HisF-related TIM barrel protein [Gemmatimonadota bacterium]|nr:HisA/HisF-related TIM barrel protein [Gemmatimonadota bacterium]